MRKDEFNPELHNRLVTAESTQHSALSTQHSYWRSLDELADTPEFREWLHREFPRGAAVWEESQSVSRRQFLKLMGASMMLAGLSACNFGPPNEKIVPYVRQPEDLVLGKPLYYTSAFSLSGYATGLLVESHTGRPIKVEGNPDHPSSLGATDAFAQASVLSLYDPDRSQTVVHNQSRSDWDSFVREFRAALDPIRGRQGAGLRILAETVNSPTLAEQLQTVLTQMPSAKWHQYEPINRDNVRAGATLAFGQDVETVYHLDKADVILALDADFLSCGGGTLRYAREFATRRDPQNMNRLYAAEPTLTLTGAKADHRFMVRASEIESFARTVARVLSVDVGGVQNFALTKRMNGLIRDLQAHRGSSLVMAGDYQPPVVHALAHAMNDALGNVGSTLEYREPIHASAVDQMQSLRDLVADIDANKVELLIILGGNPAYSAPADLGFADRLSKVANRVHLSLYSDETSAVCNWHVNAAHYLEAWSDARGHDGTTTILQPLIAPLYGGKSAHELLALITSAAEQSAHDIVRAFWQKKNGPSSGSTTLSTGFDAFWRKALNDGVIANSSARPKSVTLNRDVFKQAQTQTPVSNPPSLEIVFRPDPTLYDGQFANNAWLQELPKPLTKITWDNVALIAPALAQRMNLDNNDVVELKYQNRTVRAPVWLMPGQADNTVVVQLGYGRTRAGKVGDERGYNAYLIRNSNAPWFDVGVEMRKVGDDYALATTQRHQTIEGRNVMRAGTLKEFRANQNFVREMDEHHGGEIIYPEYKYDGYKWGMAINMSACVGCNACVVACQAENNIPVVGKSEVLRDRKMHWLRVDAYYKGTPDEPEAHFQPVPCMHCETAPCEVVCPVAATTHSSEGLNEMTYNRCIGTRYCSNNCPYKVRRFNFFQYTDYETPVLKLLNNPDVTVRSRGVMEKCTYCVQRINRARITAEREGRRIREGEVVTACQAACPTEAIIFGDLNDANSRVVKLKASPLNYAMLAELNTRPRTTYLAELRNLNPEIKDE